MDLLREYDVLKVKDKFREIIIEELKEDYFREIFSILNDEYNNFKVFPEKKCVFNAFKYKDFYEIKVVILGQDPYHGENQANGLSFSVSPKVSIPSSLKNIFKELKNDLNIEIPNHGDLTSWGKEGVLLLNSTLTVRKAYPNSHKNLGWRKFTDKIIEKLSKERENLVFILWGNYSIQKEKYIDKNKHLIIKSPHPSGLSAHKGFFLSKPFSKTNEYLKRNSIDEINWEIK